MTSQIRLIDILRIFKEHAAVIIILSVGYPGVINLRSVHRKTNPFCLGNRNNQGNLSWSSGARIHENICKSRFDFYRQNHYSKNNIVGNYESSLEMVTSGTFAILMRYGYRKTESEKKVSFGASSRCKRQKLPFEPSFFSYVKAAKFATFEFKSSCLEMF